MTLNPNIPLAALEALNNGNQVGSYLACAIVAWPGAILAVPTHLLIGDLRRMDTKCPAPWEDVLAVMDKPQPVPVAEYMDGIRPLPGSRFADVAGIVTEAGGEPGAWFVHAASWFAPGSIEQKKVRVFSHDCGVRLGVTLDLIERCRP